MIDEFFKEIGDASIHWTGDADLQSWLIQQEQRITNYTRRLQKLWVAFWMKIFQRFMTMLIFGAGGNQSNLQQFIAWEKYDNNLLDPDLTAKLQNIQDNLAKTSALDALKEYQSLYKPNIKKPKRN